MASCLSLRIRKTTVTNRKALKITRSVYRGQLGGPVCWDLWHDTGFRAVKDKVDLSFKRLIRGCLRHHQYLNSYFMTIFNMYSSILNIVNYCLSESPFNSGYGIISEPKLKLQKYGFELGWTLLLNCKKYLHPYFPCVRHALYRRDFRSETER